MKSKPLLFDDHAPGAANPSGRSVMRGVALVLVIFAGTQLLAWTGAYYGAMTLLRIDQHLDPPLSKHTSELAGQFAEREGQAYDSAVELLTDFAPLCRFDGVHYRSIIEGGYSYSPPPPDATPRELEQNIAFFPLFPLVCQSLASLMTTNTAMVLVVHVCSLAAALVLYFWVRRRIDERTAIATVVMTFCLPPSVYYSYGYAESITLLLMVIALWLIDVRAWWPAALVCGLATATRPTALAIAAVLVLAYWFNSTERRRGRRLLKLVPLGFVAGLGIMCYAAYLGYRFGSPTVYLDNFRAGWNPDKMRADWLGYLTLAPIWEQFKYFRNLIAFAPPIGLVNAPNTLMWNMPLCLFLVFVSLAGLRRVPRSFRPLLALGPLIFLHSYLSSGGAKFGIEPIARYMAVAVPALIVLAAWLVREQRIAAQCLLIAFMLLIKAAWAFRFGLQEWSG